MLGQMVILTIWNSVVTTKANVDEPFGEYVKIVEVKPLDSLSAEVGK